jgi:predicted transposase YbfD/YdcC
MQDYITLAPEMELPPSLEEVDAHSLYAAFQKITDGRCKRGIRYPVALILTLIVLAKLTGEPKLSGVSQWARLRGKWLNEVLHLQLTRWPAASTYTYVLERLDEQEVTRVIGQCLTRAETSRRCGEEPSRLATQGGSDHSAHIAMDGKTMRGTLSHEAANQGSVHLLSLYEVGTGTVLAQRAVATKENEISAAPLLVMPEQIKGRIYSADAMHTQKKWCRRLTRYQGDYLLIAKDNQSTLRTDLALFLDDPEADRSGWVTASTCNKGHGRLEKRTLLATTELNDFLARDWADVGQVFRLERTVLKKGVWHTSVVYGLTSLSPKQASPQRLLALIRAHWSIENRLHWRRDVTLGEDHSQVRSGCAPQVLAALNNTLLALMDFLHVPNVPDQMRFYQAQPLEALRLLLVKL